MDGKMSVGPCRLIALATVFCMVFLLPSCWKSGKEGQQEISTGTDTVIEIGKDTEPSKEFVNEVLPDGQDEKVDNDRSAKEECGSSDEGEVKPKIAIIIDDMGNHRQIGDKLVELDLNLTFSFLPYGPFTKEQEETAWVNGKDILVHMPMQPRDSQWDPGPDALYVDDSPEQLDRAVEKNLTRVPHAIGVNNHMGSLFTEDRPAMHRFLSIVQQKDMFFIDSVTTPASIGMEEAHEMGIRVARRNVFLDNNHDQEDICRQLQELIGIAREKGWAVGIGHANDATLTALIRCRETLLKNVTVVGIHELIH